MLQREFNSCSRWELNAKVGMQNSRPPNRPTEAVEWRQNEWRVVVGIWLREVGV